jgi:hypothetical protein
VINVRQMTLKQLDHSPCPHSVNAQESIYHHLKTVKSVTFQLNIFVAFRCWLLFKFCRNYIFVLAYFLGSSFILHIWEVLVYSYHLTLTVYITIIIWEWDLNLTLP